MDKIKVAHVIRVFSYGGAEVLLRECLSHPYFKEQVTSDLYVLDHKKLGLMDEVKPNINTARYYRISSLKFIFEYARFVRHLVEGRYDIIHVHLPAAGWMTIPVKIFTAKTKFIYSEHNLVNFYAKYNYYLIGLVYNFFDCVICVSHEIKEVIKKLKKGWFFKAKKTITIVNGIDTNKFSTTRRFDETKNILTVGVVARFRPQKRVDRWVEVAAETHKLNPDIHFLMAGDGPDEEMLREKIRALNMQEKIALPGMLSNTVNAFKHIDIFLLTSDFEGLPLALLEAMSSGCIPVVSNVGGIKQLSFDGFGYKFDQFNASAIAAVIAGYAADPGKVKNESLQARRFVEQNYSLSKQVHEIVEVYKKI